MGQWAVDAQTHQTLKNLALGQVTWQLVAIWDIAARAERLLRSFG